ncbi:MAG: type II toxin-antitoxin system HicA family toxin [bacterium]
MPPLPVLTSKQLVRLLLKLGYCIVRQRGSHIRLRAVGRKSVTVPKHDEISVGVLRKIMRDVPLETSELLKLLED